MGTCLSPGDRVSRYRIEELLNDGAYAVAYRATDTTASTRPTVFLKQYKSPSVRSGWYRGYIAYEEEIRFRIETGGLTEKTCRFLDLFESRDAGQRAYYQVFEFMERGRELAAQLEDPAFRWEQRWTFAKLMLSTLHQLHEAGIVHCDLKPENLYLVETPALSTGYRLKVIDFDHSVLADREAPWKGYENYAGTPGYLSPEHLRGECPVKASDVFTAGLLLQELLCREGHPYSLGDTDLYAEQALRFAAPLPTLRQSTGNTGDDQALASLFRQCLDPDASLRPTMKELHQALLQAGKGTLSSLASLSREEAPEENKEAAAPPAAIQWPPVPPALEGTGGGNGPVPLKRRPPIPPSLSPCTPLPRPDPLPPAAPPPPPAAPRFHAVVEESGAKEEAAGREPFAPPADGAPSSPGGCGLRLTSQDGRSALLHLQTAVGKRFMGRFGEDAKYYSDVQYTLYPEGGQWHVAPNGAAQNQTLLNGRPLEGAQPLREGDVLCVGNYARGVTKLPLVVSWSTGDQP